MPGLFGSGNSQSGDTISNGKSLSACIRSSGQGSRTPRDRRFVDSLLEGDGFELPVPREIRCFIRCLSASNSRASRGQNSEPGMAYLVHRLLTIRQGRLTLHRARLVPVMISTPGHRVLSRRHCRAPPTWFLPEELCRFPDKQ